MRITIDDARAISHIYTFRIHLTLFTVKGEKQKKAGTREEKTIS